MKRPPLHDTALPRRRRANVGASNPATDGYASELPEEDHFRRFAQASEDVFWLADPAHGKLLYVSPRVQAVWGIAAADVLGKPTCWNDAVLKEDAAQLPRPFFADEPGREDSVREYRIRAADGSVRWIRDRRFHLRDAAGRTLRIAGIAEDVSARKGREIENAELLERERAARAEAETAAAAKDEFLAVVTHELRSPLNAIRGWTHVLRHSGELQAMQLKALDAIERNTQAQAHLVDDLLDSQRIVCGKLELVRARVPLREVLEDACDAVRPAAELKHLGLKVMNDPHVGLVNVDPDRLRQALLKLLANAVKFTPEGGLVKLRSRLSGEALRLEVQDTGVGIEQLKLPLVFDRFAQADSSSTRRASGLGLGLSIARHLVELHGGHIDVRSEGAGRGATFTIELPRDTVCEGTAAGDDHASVSPLAGKRVLIVEDDDDGREALGIILRDAQVELHSFARAATAYDYLATLAPEELPDALISDIAMPDEDGYAFIRRVREMEDGRHRPHTIAMALTSFARLEDRTRALKAGFDAHVAKPLDPDRVLHTLATALGVMPSEGAVPA
jgi:PAS domain S-box-containing protein